jgi:hypothetical protein
MPTEVGGATEKGRYEMWSEVKEKDVSTGI